MHVFGVARVHPDLGEPPRIAGLVVRHVLVVRHPRPGVAAVARSEEAVEEVGRARPAADDGVQPVGIRRRDADADPAEVRRRRHQRVQPLPAGAAVGRAVHPGAHAAVGAQVRLPAVIPHDRVHPLRVHRVEHHLGGACGVGGAGQHPGPARAAVVRQVHAPLTAGVEQRAAGRHEDPLRVARVDRDMADGAGVAQPDAGPVRTAVGRAVDAGAGVGEAAAAGVRLTGAGVQRALGGDRHRAHGLRLVRRPCGGERGSGVGRAPQTAGRRGHVQRVGQPWVQGDVHDPAADVGRADQVPLATGRGQLRRLGGRDVVGVPRQLLAPQGLLQEPVLGGCGRPTHRPVLARLPSAWRFGRRGGGRHQQYSAQPDGDSGQNPLHRDTSDPIRNSA